MVIGKIIGMESPDNRDKSKIADGFFIHNKLDKCALYGSIGEDNHTFYRWFNLNTGRALEKEEAYKVNDNAVVPETHPSYGLIGFSRRNGGKRNLFGSSIKHNQSITLTIKTAEHRRDLNRDWYHGRKELIEVEMSIDQYSQLLTSMNIADGIPCTIRSREYVRVENPPFTSKVDTFNKEFKNRMHNLGVDIDKNTRVALDILDNKKSFTKEDIKLIKQALAGYTTEIRSNIPFVVEQFSEAMDKTVTAAKAEIEAFKQQQITQLGLGELKKQQELNILEDGKV